MSRNKYRSIVVLLLAMMLIGVVGVHAQGGKVTFMSTQFNVVEETDKARAIVADFGDVDFVPSDEGPMIDLLKAESQAGAARYLPGPGPR
jgi:hypothetical protein